MALRKVELANTRARTELGRQEIERATKAGVATRDDQVRQAQAALSTTREQLGEERRQNQAFNAQLQKDAASLEVEKQARLNAEDRLAGAMKDLAEVAAVKEDARGVVITLSGGVLFPSGKDTLLNTAQRKLDQVAAMLKDQAEDRNVVVEGHTDSRGSEASNQELSQRRATSVRDYLVSRDVPAARTTAVGMGESRPLVDNRTAENRANNRRVEIIIGSAETSLR